MMRLEGVEIDPEEEKMALQLSPRVSGYFHNEMYDDFNRYQVAGLAQCVHYNSVLKEKFDTHISNDKELPGDKTALDCHVTTWWNSDLTCLDAHLYFKSPVEQLTGAVINKIQAY